MTFTLKRAILKCRKLNPFHSFDVKVKPYVLCFMWSFKVHLRVPCFWMLTVMSCKYSLIKRMEMDFSSLKTWVS